MSFLGEVRCTPSALSRQCTFQASPLSTWTRHALPQGRVLANCPQPGNANGTFDLTQHAKSGVCVSRVAGCTPKPSNTQVVTLSVTLRCDPGPRLTPSLLSSPSPLAHAVTQRVSRRFSGRTARCRRRWCSSETASATASSRTPSTTRCRSCSKPSSRWRRAHSEYMCCSRIGCAVVRSGNHQADGAGRTVSTRAVQRGRDVLWCARSAQRPPNGPDDRVLTHSRDERRIYQNCRATQWRDKFISFH